MNSSVKAFAVLLLLAAIPAGAKLLEDTVAVVNGAPILLSEYQKEAATAMEYWAKTNPAAMADPANVRKLRESTLEQLIDRELLIQEGTKMKIKVREREIDNAVDEIKARFKKDDHGNPVSEAEAEAAFQQQLKGEGMDWPKFRDRLSHQILARKVIDEAVKAKMVPPTEEESKAYFAKIEKYIESKSTGMPAGMEEDEGLALREVAGQIKALSSERVRVQRVLIRLSPGATENEKKRAFKTAEAVKKRLDAGEDFAKVAKEDSEDPESAARGGDLGYVLRGVAPPELEKAAFALGVGDTSGPIFTESGYNVIRVTEKRAAEKPEFDKFKDELANFLGGSTFQRKIEAFVKGLRDKATIERNLPATATP
jgi:peptidyl-prolyl cis-trans isomerase C